ncbi:hypothetical protein BJ878DRAFT_578151 [Calycina marina]|uniref:Uncharacterized protein n=1 Tax=Calycina marina TaxID=1763456 RepID=A0A9P7YYM4_9HELO|nr:hypothetical protein BJ878DRAFT_578151 [Calycina marina]
MRIEIETLKCPRLPHADNSYSRPTPRFQHPKRIATHNRMLIGLTLPHANPSTPLHAVFTPPPSSPFVTATMLIWIRLNCRSRQPSHHSATITPLCFRRLPWQSLFNSYMTPPDRPVHHSSSINIHSTVSNIYAREHSLPTRFTPALFRFPQSPCLLRKSRHFLFSAATLLLLAAAVSDVLAQEVEGGRETTKTTITSGKTTKIATSSSSVISPHHQSTRNVNRTSTITRNGTIATGNGNGTTISRARNFTFITTHTLPNGIPSVVVIPTSGAGGSSRDGGN